MLRSGAGGSRERTGTRPRSGPKNPEHRPRLRRSVRPKGVPRGNGFRTRLRVGPPRRPIEGASRSGGRSLPAQRADPLIGFGRVESPGKRVAALRGPSQRGERPPRAPRGTGQTRRSPDRSGSAAARRFGRPRPFSRLWHSVPRLRARPDPTTGPGPSVPVVHERGRPFPLLSYCNDKSVKLVKLASFPEASGRTGRGPVDPDR